MTKTTIYDKNRAPQENGIVSFCLKSTNTAVCCDFVCVRVSLAAVRRSPSLRWPFLRLCCVCVSWKTRSHMRAGSMQAHVWCARSDAFWTGALSAPRFHVTLAGAPNSNIQIIFRTVSGILSHHFSSDMPLSDNVITFSANNPIRVAHLLFFWLQKGG